MPFTTTFCVYHPNILLKHFFKLSCTSIDPAILISCSTSVSYLFWNSFYKKSDEFNADISDNYRDSPPYKNINDEARINCFGTKPILHEIKFVVGTVFTRKPFRSNLQTLRFRCWVFHCKLGPFMLINHENWITDRIERFSGVNRRWTAGLKRAISRKMQFKHILHYVNKVRDLYIGGKRGKSRGFRPSVRSINLYLLV